jgi:ABC-type long-subunit fatty acid transport system fused permease/ATPase subunit
MDIRTYIFTDGVVHDFIETWTPAMADALSKAYPRVQVTEGTGQWIQENDQYQSWEQSKNGVLWINGLRELYALSPGFFMYTSGLTPQKSLNNSPFSGTHG